MAVKIVTDSTADLPSHLAKEWSISVVPLNVTFGLETYRDGVDILPDEFYRRLVSSPRLPVTSQPSLGDFVKVYSRLAEEGNDIISIHVSGTLSGTLNGALKAKAQIQGSSHIEVIDSRQASMGLGLIALMAARVAKAGGSHKEVLEEVRRVIPKVRLLGMLDTLEYVQRGGRIGKAQAFLGSLFRIKPILSIKDGEVHPVERVRTRQKAMERIVEIVQGLAPLEELCVLHSTTPEKAEALAESLSSLMPKEKIIAARFGPVVGTHLGPGGLGVALTVSPHTHGQ